MRTIGTLWRGVAGNGMARLWLLAALAVPGLGAGYAALGADRPATAGATPIADENTAAAAPAPAEQDQLKLSADTMDMDFAERVATFQGSVLANDSRMTLEADKMIVTLTSEDELRRIEALGNVVIREAGTNRRATAGKAEYDVEEGRIVLTEEPRLHDVEKGQSITGATRIVYDRKTEKFRVEGQRQPGRPDGRPTITVPIPKGKNADFSPFGGDKDKKDGPGKEEK
jgi:lipopolysaccharide transport protein LptA